MKTNSCIRVLLAALCRGDRRRHRVPEPDHRPDLPPDDGQEPADGGRRLARGRHSLHPDRDRAGHGDRRRRPAEGHRLDRDRGPRPARRGHHRRLGHRSRRQLQLPVQHARVRGAYRGHGGGDGLERQRGAGHGDACRAGRTAVVVHGDPREQEGHSRLGRGGRCHLHRVLHDERHAAERIVRPTGGDPFAAVRYLGARERRHARVPPQGFRRRQRLLVRVRPRHPPLAVHPGTPGERAVPRDRLGMERYPCHRRIRGLPRARPDRAVVEPDRGHPRHRLRRHGGPGRHLVLLRGPPCARGERDEHLQWCGAAAGPSDAGVRDHRNQSAVTRGQGEKVRELRVRRRRGDGSRRARRTRSAWSHRRGDPGHDGRHRHRAECGRYDGVHRRWLWRVADRRPHPAREPRAARDTGDRLSR